MAALTQSRVPAYSSWIRRNRTVRFDRRGVELDPGGIGKGYAVDRMVDVLKQNGIKIALVSGSYSSIYGMGAPPNEPRGWQIKIRDPKDRAARRWKRCT